jgi:putative membrane protein
LYPTGALNDYINKAVKRYSSLFTLPSHKTLAGTLFLTCLAVGVFAVLPILSFTQGLLMGLVLGTVLFFLTMMSDFAIYACSLRSDPIFNLRRCSALSLYSSILWGAFALLGTTSYILFGFVHWIRFPLLGLCAMIILRLLVFSAVSFARVTKIVFYSTLQPALYAMVTIYIGVTGNYSFDFATLLFFALSAAAGAFSVFLFVFSLNRTGTKLLGAKSLSVLKVFMANWTEDLNEPLENLLERLSVKRSIKLSLILFRTKEKAKAAMVIPSFHPGPFKNVGSSALPYLIQKELEKRLGGVISVPHGLSGHDLDLASQTQNQKIIQKISEISDFPNFSATATPFLRVQKNGASVSCQVFGKCALLTLTLAPRTMEDLPGELESFISKEAQKRGLQTAMTIDAHNSIEGPFNSRRAVSTLKEAAVASLDRALESQVSPVQMGAAKIVPRDLSLKDGMGPGGICAIAVKVKEQLVTYITIDGNNMVSGLREKILRRLRELGFDDGEILTTDTHVVNGIVLTPRGYHPLGEAIEHEKLMKYIEQAAINAKDNLEPAEAAYFTKEVPNVKVVGEEQVGLLCMLTEKAFQRAKRLASTVFPLVGLIWVILLFSL